MTGVTVARNAEGKNLTHALVEKIGTLIVRGDVAAGESLPIEAEISSMFSSSRTVTREAVKMLTAKGLVGQRPKRGTYVEPESNWNFLDPDVLQWILQRSFSPSLMKEFLVVRRAIEPAAAAEVIAHASDKEIAVIGEALENFRQAERGEGDPLEADIAFHVSILETSGNRFLRQFRALVETALRFSIRKINEEKGIYIADIGKHARIYEAIRDRDQVRAAMLYDELFAGDMATMETIEKKAREAGQDDAL